MRSHPRVLMLFLDGVGIGRADRVNPFFTFDLPELTKLLGGEILHLSNRRVSTRWTTAIPLNATLGVEGFPQSGTGQTALLTGVNAARMIGKHFGPYPYSSLRPLIADRNIFLRLREAGRKAYYANAFPQRYFDHMKNHGGRVTAIVASWVSAGFALNDVSALRREKALSADVTNERWVALGFGDVPIITPRQAGHRLVRLLEENDFVFYEYYLTDHAGHSTSMERAGEVLNTVDELLGGVMEALDLRRMTFLITSDHGNLEDLSTKSHTRNPVPLVVTGAGRAALTSRTRNLTHVTPALIELLN